MSVVEYLSDEVMAALDRQQQALDRLAQDCREARRALLSI